MQANRRQLPQYYSPLNWLLTVTGLGICHQSRWARYINNATFIVTLMNCAVRFFNALKFTAVMFNHDSLLVVSMTFTNLLALLVIKFNHSVFHRTLMFSSQYLTAVQQRKLKLIGLIAVLIMTLDTLFRMFLLYKNYNLFDMGWSQRKIIFYIFFDCLQDYLFNVAMMAIVMTYVFDCLIYSEIRISIIRNSSRTDLSVADLEVVQHHSNMLINSFNEKISVTVITKFVSVFVEALSFFLANHTFEIFSVPIVQISTIYHLVFNLVCILVIVTIIDYSNRKIRTEYCKQYDVILTRDGFSARAVYLLSTEKQYELRLTAYEFVQVHLQSIKKPVQLNQKKSHGVFDTSEGDVIWRNPSHPETDNAELDIKVRLVTGSEDYCYLQIKFHEFTLSKPTRGQCLEDVLMVNGTQFCGQEPIDAIYGEEHDHFHAVKVISPSQPVDMTFSTRGGSFARKWRIRVHGIKCKYHEVFAGCTQYNDAYNGSIVIRSFNYPHSMVNGLLTTDEPAVICIRLDKARKLYQLSGNSTTTLTIKADSNAIGGFSTEAFSLDAQNGDTARYDDHCPDMYLEFMGQTASPVRRFCGGHFSMMEVFKAQDTQTEHEGARCHGLPARRLPVDSSRSICFRCSRNTD
ncbi:hypothetical protein HDE_06731 [Halotydeus destructor]|nr:hypothetical protein HDE_06731 [Halotydeus destructor]